MVEVPEKKNGLDERDYTDAEFQELSKLYENTMSTYQPRRDRQGTYRSYRGSVCRGGYWLQIRRSRAGV